MVPRKKEGFDMSDTRESYSRRDFIKTAGAAGLGSVLLPFGVLNTAHGTTATDPPGAMVVPTRPFGKTGVEVSILSLGGVLGMSDQLMFRQAVKMGVTYWDTADSYGLGNNEAAIGKYFARFPEDRKKVFLVTKTSTADPEKLTEKLDSSLQKMNTSYVDLYFIHHVSNAEKKLTADVRAWAERAKTEGKIKFFGFSAHKNMEANMLAAAELGWIDGIMMSYNYRLMQKDEMKRAMDACVRAGIGLTAMKTQAAFSANFYASIGKESDDAGKMIEGFLARGYTPEQAKLKVVWENPHIASICSAMPNMTILQANVAAAVNRENLSTNDKRRLDQYARLTAPGYCAGCASICESAANHAVPISDIMRYLMYDRAYGKPALTAGYFRKIQPVVRRRLVGSDFSEAERRCPQRMPIARLMREAAERFA
jgi:aryl-alcohol dehydrogenase-like predicted oxidoreductase